MKENNRKIFEKLLFGIPLSIILISFLIILFKGQLNFGTVNFENLGGYGSFIGGIVGTFLTIIATYYVYKTYHSQKIELKKQKKQLRLQSDLIAQQQFESTFFNMLNVHRELKNGLKFKNILIIINGVEEADFYEGLATINFINKSFRVKYENLKKNNQNPVGMIQDFELEQLKLDLSKYDDINELNILKVVFNKLYKTHQNQISHYCRNIYHILKFIRENEKNKTLGEVLINIKAMQIFFNHN